MAYGVVVTGLIRPEAGAPAHGDLRAGRPACQRAFARAA